MLNTLQLIAITSIACFACQSGDNRYADSAPGRFDSGKPSLSIEGFDPAQFASYYALDEVSLFSQVTLAEYPSGSLRYDYAGPYKIAMSKLRRKLKRSWSKEMDIRTSYMTASEARSISELQDLSDDAVDTNGFWWNRRWFESLSEELGGAPALPYKHTYGKDIEWVFGPVTVSNTLSVDLDFLAVFRLNVDPDRSYDPEIDASKQSKTQIEVDLHRTENISYGTAVRFDVKPRISVKLPKRAEISEIAKKLSIEAEAEISVHGKTVIVAQCELSYRPNQGVEFEFEVALVNW